MLMDVKKRAAGSRGCKTATMTRDGLHRTLCRTIEAASFHVVRCPAQRFPGRNDAARAHTASMALG
jgi:hypothetical protein